MNERNRRHLSRQPGNSAWRTVIWNGCDAGDWRYEIEGADLLINFGRPQRELPLQRAKPAPDPGVSPPRHGGAGPRYCGSFRAG